MKDRVENIADSKSASVVVIAGGGPAGLTAAYELAFSDDFLPIVLEETDMVGGISRTEHFKGNRIDIGGHRFFSKSDRVMNWWNNIMPFDADPDRTERTMLTRRRVSRIYYLRRFFDYPVKMNLRTVRNLGLARTFKAGLSYLKSTIVRREEKSLEDFYINRFGRTLYRMFFEDYTKKVWGVHPSCLGADWGSQRIKGLSLSGVLKDMILKWRRPSRSNCEVETSLIDKFLYPKYGPGQLWETVADDMVAAGGELHKNFAVSRVHVKGDKVTAVTIKDVKGDSRRVECDFFLSSMPIKDLILSLEGVDIPPDVMSAAESLPYRDFITVGLLVDKLKLHNETRLKIYKNRIPDTWIYIQEKDVRLGRIQVFNNWSPYMVADDADKMWIGLEYFCSEGDEMWRMSDEQFVDFAIDELVKIDVVDREDVKDSVRIKVKKAYPAYFGSYEKLPEIRAFLDTIKNLFCIGRNGQHRYNNMDHSMLTAMEAVDLIKSGKSDKSRLWNVNTESDYHESK